ncbi:hypothetical protein P5G65_18880 [Paenibacillus chondroitinus]|uniref:Uncharacterized protein n=1 Tax=Paenibacillus chondroitinus TaxID=59842 RepID=A0ABU6DDY6_9BACL|nr:MULTISPECIES: hypothetical protein [Paenibacillus]MCY9657291.1 hypothetical protein [Paenibacillus anseongense]MEB4795970.1 hypothetical protein [Paenibacillus chondroitinus]
MLFARSEDDELSNFRKDVRGQQETKANEGLERLLSAVCVQPCKIVHEKSDAVFV